jgi:hypothetical protein
MLAAVKAVSVAAASSVARLSVPKKSFRSSDFGGGARKKGCARSASKTATLALPLEAVAPSRSKAAPRRFNIKSSSNALPGPVSQGNWLLSWRDKT